MRLSNIVGSFLWLAALSVLTACSPDQTALENGQKPPPFSLPDLNGQEQSLDRFDGKVVVVRFWADWCPFCESEMTQIEPVYRGNKERGLEILAINVRQDHATAQSFMQKLGVTYPGLLDEEGEVARQYGVIGLPTTFVIDREGVLQTKIIGESTAQVLESVVNELL